MKVGKRGLRLRQQLLLLSLVLLALPWLGYRYVEEMRSFLLSGQESAQALTAQAIATVLHERSDLFEEGTDAPQDGTSDDFLYAYPLNRAMQLDGYEDDWRPLQHKAIGYSSAMDSPGSAAATESQLVFDLLLGVREQYLYALLRIRDEQLVYHHPGLARDAGSDQVRLRFKDRDGTVRELVFLAEGPGSTQVRERVLDQQKPLTPARLAGVSGHFLPTGLGYHLELRLPLALLTQAQQLSFRVLDVDDVQMRTLVATHRTNQRKSPEILNTLRLRSSELERILAGLERSQARIWILDPQGTVRAQVGSLRGYDREDQDLETAIRQEPSVLRALQGEAAMEHRDTLDGEGTMIMATHPIISKEVVQGAVLVEQSTADILSLQRHTLERMGGITLLVLGIIIASLMWYASRLALRMRRLSREAHAAIDRHGRVLHTQLASDQGAADEFGELSRTISGLLQRLSRYTRFLEQLPRLLRHEINNPLNVISTSLQNLAADPEAAAHQPYVSSAQRGVQRIGAIVQALTEAANLEEALRQEEQSRVSLVPLLENYRESCAMQYPDHRFHLHTPDNPVYLQANDFRLEQLLDKLVDNAVDFTPAGGTIHLDLETRAPWIQLEIRNPGKPLDSTLLATLFDSMVSRREATTAPGTQTTHLGMGLYVARLIVEHLGGEIHAENRHNPPEVALCITLPLSPSSKIPG